MITREEAIERALDYLTGGLRQRLKAFEGWPGGAERNEFGRVPHSRQIPDSLGKRSAPNQAEPEAADDGRIVGMPQRVWRVHVPGNGGQVGPDHFVIVDADTGRVLTEMHWGE